MSSLIFWVKSRYKSLIPIFLLALCWEFIPRFSNKAIYFPKISLIVAIFYDLIGKPDYIENILFTLSRSILGFLLAAILMTLIGILMGRYNKFYLLFQPIIEFFRPLPSAVIIPVALLFFGIGDEMKLFVIFFGSSWPILINTIEGVKSVEPLYIKTGIVFGLSKYEILRKIIIPSSMPLIITGYRIGIAISLILSITVEMIVGGNGLGYFILDAERSFKFPEMYAGIFTVGLIGIFINSFILYIESVSIKWYKLLKQVHYL